MIKAARCILSHQIKWSQRLFVYSTYSTKTDTSTKSKSIASSIQQYLKYAKEYESNMLEHKLEYEDGKKHLARMMGMDVVNFTQEHIDDAIHYLLPTGFTSTLGQPKMKPPEIIISQKKSLECSDDGRPLHAMFYTGQPNFYSLMHDASVILERLKQKEDEVIRATCAIPQSNQNFLSSLINTAWISQKDLSTLMMEKISDSEYQEWKQMMDRLCQHPLAFHAQNFINTFRKPLYKKPEELSLPEPKLDEVTGRYYVESFGQKKRSLARLTLTMPGTGKININDKSLLEAFPELGDREQIMFPLQLLDQLGNVDIVAYVQDSGHGSQSNALRSALARALSCFASAGDRERLRLAGLLTNDMRFGERKWPGQPKSRKKFIWKAR